VPCNSFADFLNAEGVFSLTVSDATTGPTRTRAFTGRPPACSRPMPGSSTTRPSRCPGSARGTSAAGEAGGCRARRSGRRRREARTSAHIPWAGSRPGRNAPSSVTATTRPRVGTPPCRPQPPRVEDLPGNLRQWTSSILRPYPVPARERPRRPCRSGARGRAWGQPRRSDRLVVHQHASLVRPARRRRGPPRRRVSLRDLGRPGGDHPLSKGVAAREANAAAGSTLPTGCA
jgi:hypothetical protein